MIDGQADLDRMFHALSDRSRRGMIDRLGRGPASVTELAAPLAVALPTVMKHLQVLEESGLVLSEKSGRVRTYRLQQDALAAVEAKDPRLAVLVEPTLGVTLTPTMIGASEKVNVIPARAWTRIDCRVPPGLGREHAERRAREVLGEGDFELEFGECAVGNRSRHDSPLMDAIGEWLGEADPEATPVPTVPRPKIHEGLSHQRPPTGRQ